MNYREASEYGVGCFMALQQLMVINASNRSGLAFGNHTQSTQRGLVGRQKQMEFTAPNSAHEMAHEIDSTFTTRSPPVGQARKNAAILNFIILADIQSNSVRHYW